MRAIIQSAYILRREVLRLLRLRTTGVKVMLFNDADELLLIRNAYGDCGQYLLPGGGVSRDESPAAAAIREVREEIGIELDRVEPVWTFESNAEGKRDTIHLFKAKTRGRPEIDGLTRPAHWLFAIVELTAPTRWISGSPRLRGAQ